MRASVGKLIAVLMGLGVFMTANVKASLQLTWNPSTSATVAGYYLCWGLSSGQYTFTNTYPSTTTNGTVGVSDTNVYYIAVAAFDSNNFVSQFSNQIMVTNSAATETNVPPINFPPNPTNSTNIASTNSPVNPSTNTSPPVAVNAIMWGAPPALDLGISNHSPYLNVAGLVGQTLEIQSNNSPGSQYSWTVMAEVTLTNIAEIAATNPPANPDAIDLAFVPSSQKFQLPGGPPHMMFYRTVMPYDYAVLAGQVLPPKGYPSRLILVTMPGYSDDACYVTPQSSYIHFSSSSNTFELQSSGSTIRQIANQLASSLGQNWTTASEFVYSNGMGLIQATVVETEDPSTDPVAQNTVSSAIQINF